MQPVKLQVHAHQGEEIVVDSFPAESWDDFLVIRVGNLGPDQLVSLGSQLEQLRDQTEKHIFLVSDDMTVEFYGFKDTQDYSPSDELWEYWHEVQWS
jgi:hypothetical protein